MREKQTQKPGISSIITMLLVTLGIAGVLTSAFYTTKPELFRASLSSQTRNSEELEEDITTIDDTTMDEEELCGNGFVDEGEECDDGNDYDNDRCNSNCERTFCGDGTMQSLNGEGEYGINEECDDGNNDDCDGCDSECRYELCGNNRIDCGEDCDPFGITDPTDTPACDADCTFAECGDGYWNEVRELCDDAGDSSDCDADCSPAECGDGYINEVAGEECDDGNRNDNDTCNSDCELNNDKCGNGRIEPNIGEECDDGNESDGDGCNSDCEYEYCCNPNSDSCTKMPLLRGRCEGGIYRNIVQCSINCSFDDEETGSGGGGSGGGGGGGGDVGGGGGSGGGGVEDENNEDEIVAVIEENETDTERTISYANDNQGNDIAFGFEVDGGVIKDISVTPHGTTVSKRGDQVAFSANIRKFVLNKALDAIQIPTIVGNAAKLTRMFRDAIGRLTGRG